METRVLIKTLKKSERPTSVPNTRAVFLKLPPLSHHCRFITTLEVVCFRLWRSLPCLCKSSCLCNQRRSSCSRPGLYNRFGLCTRVYPFRHRPWFGGRRQDCSTCAQPSDVV